MSTESPDPEAPTPAGTGIKSSEPRNRVELPTSLERVPEEYEQPSYQQGRLEYFTYSTGAQDDEGRDMQKRAIVYLPYGYDYYNAPKQYNVMYYMHGAGGSVETFLGAPYEPSVMRNIVDNLIAYGDMDPVIIVCPTFYPDNDTNEAANWGAQLTEDFGRELRDDLMPALEEKYRTYATDTTPAGLAAARGHRAFGGFSMGGVTTWYRMCDCMDYFEYYLPLSGNLLWGVEARKQSSSPVQFTTTYVSDAIARQGYGKDDFFLFAATGDGDYALNIVNSQMAALRLQPSLFVTDNSAGEANVMYLVADGEGHDGANGCRFFYNALPLVSSMMP